MLENPGPQSMEFDAALLRASVLQRGRPKEVQFLGGKGLQVAGVGGGGGGVVVVVQPTASAQNRNGRQEDYRKSPTYK